MTPQTYESVDSIAQGHEPDQTGATELDAGIAALDAEIDELEVRLDDLRDKRTSLIDARSVLEELRAPPKRRQRQSRDLSVSIQPSELEGMESRHAMLVWIAGKNGGRIKSAWARDLFMKMGLYGSPTKASTAIYKMLKNSDDFDWVHKGEYRLLSKKEKTDRLLASVPIDVPRDEPIPQRYVRTIGSTIEHSARVEGRVLHGAKGAPRGSLGVSR